MDRAELTKLKLGLPDPSEKLPRSPQISRSGIQISNTGSEELYELLLSPAPGVRHRRRNQRADSSRPD
jgi:hypothetical protein